MKTEQTLPVAFLLLPLLLFLGTVTTLPSQPLQIPTTDCIGGTLYYVAFPDTVTNVQDPRYPPKYSQKSGVMIYSQTTQKVILSTSEKMKTVLIEGGTFAEVNFDEDFDGAYHVVPNTILRKGVRITALSPIVVYASTSTHFGGEAFTPQPVEAWGTEYYVASWEGEKVRDIYLGGEHNFDAHLKKPAPAEILVIAAYDNTRVTIRPTGELFSCQGCGTVTLNAGQTYLVQSRVDTNDQFEHQADIAGTYITSTKPIGVLSGNTRTQIEPFSITTLGGNSFKDLAIEWIRPVSQHGTGFVFMPTWDEHYQDHNAPIEREAEFVRLYGTDNSTITAAVRDTRGGEVPVNKSILSPGQYSHERIGAAGRARSYATTGKAMAFQSPKSIPHYAGTTGSGNFIGASYDAWGTYMVEMIPRESWTTIAPVRAAFLPDSAQHYINVVTDRPHQANVFVKKGTGTPVPFVFMDTIAGTDLIWGSMSIDSGADYLFFGTNDAHFGGYVYGSWKGYELYRPNATADGGDGKGAASAGASRPADYEENIAQMYGYPLPASLCMAQAPTTYTVQTVEEDCGVVRYEITGDNPNGALKYIRINPDSSANVRLELVQPSVSDSLQQGVRNAIIRLVPVDPTKGAVGVVEFTDRSGSGQVYRLSYSYEPKFIDPAPTFLMFNYTQTDSTQVGQRAVLRNSRSTGVTVRGFSLQRGDQGFRITGVLPAIAWNGTAAVPYTIPPGDSLVITLGFFGNPQQVADDSLIVDYGCFTRGVDLRAQMTGPCLRISNVNFGDVKEGEMATGTMEICNVGGGTVRFSAATATEVITWLASEFSVSLAELEKLRNTDLNAGECVTIQVSFRSPGATGSYQTIAHIRASSSGCGDTAIWRANVVSNPSGVEDLTVRGASQILSIDPNPANGGTRIGISLAARGSVTATLVDLRGREVLSLFEGELEAGGHYLNSNVSQLPSGIYYLRIASGSWEEIRPFHIVR